MSLAFALLAIAANVAVLGYVARWVTSRRNPIVDALDGYEHLVAAVVATVSTLGSLYLSEIAHLIPCRLCWVQRAFMYPLAVILLVTLVRKTAPPLKTSLTLAAVGGAVAIYHYTTQLFPSLDSGVCAAAVPCSAPYFMRLGWISIPYMAASSFLLIVVLLISPRTRIRTTEMTMEAAA